MEWQLWIVHEENEPQIPFLWGSPLLHLPPCSAARGSSARREISERVQAQAAGVRTSTLMYVPSSTTCGAQS